MFTAVFRQQILRSASHTFKFFSCIMSKKSALVVLSEGSEEMEFVITVDVLRRGGVEVTVAGLQGSQPLEGSKQVKIVPDMSFDDAAGKKKYDIVVLPGGLKGAEEFSNHAGLGKLLKEQEKGGRKIGAICAAPTALKSHKIFSGKKLTSYPAMESQLTEGKGYTYLQDKVVVDGNLITSRGPGTAFDFAIAMVEQLVGKEVAGNISKEMLLV